METQIQSALPEIAAAPVQVWLVDDNDKLRVLIAETLERMGSINCSRQFDSPNGLLSTLASRNGPDVILLDVQMGEHNGLDALPAIKSLARETRVYMLTTFFDPGWHRQAMDSGASGYYLKGDSIDRLVECIRDRSGTNVPVRRRLRRPKCSGKPATTLSMASTSGRKKERGSTNQKPVPLFGWFRRFSRN
jgi:DNA-binding NarL/FixJ family response regulator